MKFLFEFPEALNTAQLPYITEALFSLGLVTSPDCSPPALAAYFSLMHFEHCISSWCPFFSHPILSLDQIVFLVTAAITTFTLITLCSYLSSSDTLLYLFLTAFCCYFAFFLPANSKTIHMAEHIKLLKFW